MSGVFILNLEACLLYRSGWARSCRSFCQPFVNHSSYNILLHAEFCSKLCIPSLGLANNNMDAHLVNLVHFCRVCGLKCNKKKHIHWNHTRLKYWNFSGLMYQMTQRMSILIGCVIHAKCFASDTELQNKNIWNFPAKSQSHLSSFNTQTQIIPILAAFVVEERVVNINN